MTTYENRFKAAQPLKWQKKNLQATINTGAGSNFTNVPDLAFDNLEIGKTYKLHLKAHLVFTGTSVTELARLDANHDGIAITHLESRNDQQGERTDLAAGVTTIFTAAATTITFELESNVTGTVLLEASPDETYSILEELPNHIETSDFT